MAGANQLNKFASIFDLMFVCEKFNVNIHEAVYVSDIFVTFAKVAEMKKTEVDNAYIKLKNKRVFLQTYKQPFYISSQRQRYKLRADPNTTEARKKLHTQPFALVRMYNFRSVGLRATCSQTIHTPLIFARLTIGKIRNHTPKQTKTVLR